MSYGHSQMLTELRQQSCCLTVVLVSDDPTFLAAFAEWSLKTHLLVWPTRLLVVTQVPLSELWALQMMLSMTNSVLLIMKNEPKSVRCNVYVHLPYNAPRTKALLVGSWSPLRGLIHTTHLPLFPDKFSKFPHKPKIVVSSEEFPFHKAVMKMDPTAPGGQRLWFKGYMADLLEYVARSLNFTYVFVRPLDKIWGSKQDDGSWSGMVGMVMREEADIGLGPYSFNPSRAEAVDFTWPIGIENTRIIAGRGRPEVDPWGFLLPLAPLVWAAILTALLVVLTSVFLLSSCLPEDEEGHGAWSGKAFQFIRILLQQSIRLAGKRWWERAMLLLWMMTTLVLTRSYASNLMSLLAVRHIPQPYQTLRDVLDDTSVTMIWQSNSTNAHYFRSVDFGIYKEVADAEKGGRTLFVRIGEFAHYIDTLVSQGDHVLIEAETLTKFLLSIEFSRRGKCDFYLSRGGFLPRMYGLIGQKKSPIVPAISKSIVDIMEVGLYDQWLKQGVPNSTSCHHLPTKITVSTSLALSNSWGMFVVIVAGHTLGVLLLCLEIFVARILKF
ncbi:probable glutamate receptor [Panulirus ornatus]|uniref:probable glutamate receptor n=1 Tax=Panulirus ornatus TaxID=150431 RepID=UPI003A89FD31